MDKENTVTFKFQIPGRCVVKKNSQRVVGFGKSKHVIYSPKFIAWHKVAMLHLRQRWTDNDPINEFMKLTIRFYFANHQSEADVSNLIEGPQDALTKAGVIVDDKLIYEIHAMKIFGEEPRTEIELEMLDKPY